MNNKFELEMDKLPRHIGIIMDGNGRWAKKRNLPRFFGHREGALRVLDIIEECYNLKISNLTLYAFSTENWKRPKTEVDHLMKLLAGFIEKNILEMHKNEIRLCVIGDVSAFSDTLRNIIEKALKLTENNSKMIVNVALNYGGQDEIVRAAKNIASLVKEDKIKVEDITKELFEKNLYTSEQPPLDLLIRPSGELRVSNFMLYQLAYAEFWFSDILWPDFKEDELHRALLDYQKRNRRFGGI